MPTLEQVMRSAVDGAAFRASAAWRLRDEDVVAVRLATGAPCAGHGAMFEDWPGPQRDVTRWFRLASGDAVGITDPPRGSQQVYLWTTEPDHA